jgi:single-strand DNA-binding protein
MQGFSNVNIVGNLGRDPEMHFSKNGNPFTRFSVAVNHRTKSGEFVNWYNVTCFGGLAEIVNENLRKGYPVMVNGNLQLESYTGKDGTPKNSLSVIADNVHFLGRNDDAGSSDNGGDDADEHPPF